MIYYLEMRDVVLPCVEDETHLRCILADTQREAPPLLVRKHLALVTYRGKTVLKPKKRKCYVPGW